MNTNDLRKAASAVHLALPNSIAAGLAIRLDSAANEIDQLEAELAIAAAQVVQLTAALKHLEVALARIAACPPAADVDMTAIARQALAMPQEHGP